jgi:hypothetical protein
MGLSSLSLCFVFGRKVFIKYFKNAPICQIISLQVKIVVIFVHLHFHLNFLYYDKVLNVMGNANIGCLKFGKEQCEMSVYLSFVQAVCMTWGKFCDVPLKLNFYLLIL